MPEAKSAGYNFTRNDAGTAYTSRTYSYETPPCFAVKLHIVRLAYTALKMEVTQLEDTTIKSVAA